MDVRPLQALAALALLTLPATGLAQVVGAPTTRAAEQPRELLQPPKVSIASPITDRFALRGSYWQPGVTSDLRYDDAAGGLGTELVGEEDLGLDDELNKGRLEMTLRMLDRHRVRMDWFQLKRSGEAVMSETVEFGDNTWLTGDRVFTDSDLRFLGLTYTYSFLKAERFEFGGGLGLHLFQAEGAASVPTRRLREDFDAAGPFPTIAVDGTYRVTKRFSINARAQYFGVGLSDVDGSLGMYHADVQFRAFPNLAVGLGYTKISLNVDSVADDFSGRLSFDTKGPEAFVRVSF